MYSVAAAAAVAGVDKITLIRAIQEGRISAVRTELNEWRVDPAELYRFFGHADEDPVASTEQDSARRPFWLKERPQLKGQLDAMAAKRLAGLARSDQQSQQAARARWWSQIRSV